MNELSKVNVVIPVERESVPNRVNRIDTKVSRVIKLGGDEMIKDIAGRNTGFAAGGRRVADWGNANGIPMTDSTGEAAIRKLVNSGKLAVRPEVRSGLNWKVLVLPDQSVVPLK